MEFLSEYSSELMLGGSSTIGGFLVAILKGFSKKLNKIDERLAQLEKNLEINTALDKQRNGKR